MSQGAKMLYKKEMLRSAEKTQKRKYLKVQEYQEEISESEEDLRAESGGKLCFEEVKNVFFRVQLCRCRHIVTITAVKFTLH